MIKAKKLNPKKYKIGTWSKANMTFTRAENWAAWEKSKSAEKLSSEVSEHVETGMLNPGDGNGDRTRERSDFLAAMGQSGIDCTERCCVHEVSKDASA